ncbi:MAG TPA: right-handed parallel beta-helix repeat-containing protein [Thermoleophilaceae bacterium]|nr:right-handed parallel beta-helix repeat-containing protein [Thermoleophilaceae bacterium]
MKTARGAAVLAAVLTGALVLVPGASAKTRVVKPGKSIQAAINASSPGDIVRVKEGVYRESLEIAKNDILLEGERGAVLKQPATPPNTLCNQFSEGAVTGICIHGQVAVPAGGPPDVVKLVRGVIVRHLNVEGFSGDGVFIYGGKQTIIRALHLLDNGGYGSFANTSRGTKYINNDVQRSGAPGLYVGDSPEANATIRGNYVKGNHGEGILLRSASQGHVRKNIIKANCAGILVLADAPGPARKWTITNNAIAQNNKACAGEPDEGEPAISGLGIGLIGARDTTVAGNGLYRNRQKGHPSFASGGIVVTKGVEGTPEHNLLIQANGLDQDEPFDISWDKVGTKISFVDNRCSTSKPSSICS